MVAEARPGADTSPFAPQAAIASAMIKDWTCRPTPGPEATGRRTCRRSLPCQRGSSAGHRRSLAGIPSVWTGAWTRSGRAAWGYWIQTRGMRLRPPAPSHARTRDRWPRVQGMRSGLSPGRTVKGRRARREAPHARCSRGTKTAMGRGTAGRASAAIAVGAAAPGRGRKAIAVNGTSTAIGRAGGSNETCRRTIGTCSVWVHAPSQGVDSHPTLPPILTNAATDSQVGSHL